MARSMIVSRRARRSVTKSSAVSAASISSTTTRSTAPTSISTRRSASSSAAIAISIGVGYVWLLDGVIGSLIESVADALPGSVLTALAKAGTDAVSQQQALALGAGYAWCPRCLRARAAATRRDRLTEA